VVTLLAGVVTARYNILQPKTSWRHHAMEEDEIIDDKPTMPLVKAWLPYGLIVGQLDKLVTIIEERRDREGKYIEVSALDWEAVRASKQVKGS
jgi:L-lactate permease